MPKFKRLIYILKLGTLKNGQCHLNLGVGEWGIILIVQSVVIFDMVKEVCITYRKPARELDQKE